MLLILLRWEYTMPDERQVKLPPFIFSDDAGKALYYATLCFSFREDKYVMMSQLGLWEYLYAMRTCEPPENRMLFRVQQVEMSFLLRRHYFLLLKWLDIFIGVFFADTHFSSPLIMRSRFSACLRVRHHETYGTTMLYSRRRRRLSLLF